MTQDKASVVHFTEVFIEESKGIIQEEDVRSIVYQLSIDRQCGTTVSGIPYLRRLELEIIGSSVRYHVWYLDFSDTPRIEVVGFSESETSRTSMLSKNTIWRMAKYAVYLRAVYRAFAWSRDNLEKLL